MLTYNNNNNSVTKYAPPLIHTYVVGGRFLVVLYLSSIGTPEAFVLAFPVFFSSFVLECTIHFFVLVVLYQLVSQESV